MENDERKPQSIYDRWASDQIPTSSCSQCNFCKNLKKNATCRAFINGIPREITKNKFIHKKPYEGDNGIMYEPKSPEYAEIKFMPFGKTEI